jgi:ketosteroid isomerase-like protein
MQTEETRELVKRYYAALGSGDKDGVLATLADDVVWDPPASAHVGRTEGAAAVAKALGSSVIKETFDISKPFDVEIRSMIVDGDKAVVQQRIIATAKATGAPYDNQYCWVYTCADGKITHLEEYADTLVAGRAMGWDL